MTWDIDCGVIVDILVHTGGWRFTRFKDKKYQARLELL